MIAIDTRRTAQRRHGSNFCNLLFLCSRWWTRMDCSTSATTLELASTGLGQCTYHLSVLSTRSPKAFQRIMNVPHSSLDEDRFVTRKEIRNSDYRTKDLAMQERTHLSFHSSRSRDSFSFALANPTFCMHTYLTAFLLVPPFASIVIVCHLYHWVANKVRS